MKSANSEQQLRRFCMKEKYMRFGEYIRRKRLADLRELTMDDVGKYLGYTQQYISAVENGHKRPFEGDKLKLLAEYLRLSEEETALMFDLASRESREVPYDLEDTLMHEEVGDLIRYAARQSRDGFIKEEDWKTFIRQMESRKKTQEGAKDG
jgi:transcriptional regulator with XRE-family HTH domain